MALSWDRLAWTLAVAAAAGVLASCSLAPAPVTHNTREYFSQAKYGPASPRVVAANSPVPKGGGRYTVGNAYRVAGKTYIPRDNPRYAETGLASWYGAAFHGRLTANGEIYDVNGLTAAHPTLPLPSYVRVTNLGNGRSLTVRVNDRGPFAHGRIIDVSATVAERLDFKRAGTARVKVEYIGPAQMDGRDYKTLMASYRGPNSGSQRTLFASRPPAAGSFVLASAPTPRVKPRRLPDDAFAPAPAAAAGPMVLMPAFAPVSATFDDPMGSLIIRSGFVSSYAEVDALTAAEQAAEDLARADLGTSLARAAAKKASEIGGPSTVVQIGSFRDPDNAERIAGEFSRFGRPETRVRESDGRRLHVVRVMVDSRTTPAAVIGAAAGMGLPDAFVLQP
jgi:rare lipoprotein A